MRVLNAVSGSPQRRNGPLASFFWILLLGDVCFLFIRNGGMAVWDFVIHGLFLIVAAVVMTRIKFGHPLRPGWLVIALLPPLWGLIQLVPLPAPLFAWLAPIKYETAKALSSLFPDLLITTNITMMPDYHLFLLMGWFLDAALILLLVWAPRPNRRLVFGVLHFISLLLALLHLAEQRELLPESGFLSIYRGTLGGLVNPNHFATLTAVLIGFQLQYLIAAIHRLSKLWWGTDREQLADFLIAPLISLVTLTFSFWSFSQAYSRSGVISLFLVVGTILGIMALKGKKRGSRGYNWRWLLLAGGLLVILFLPLGQAAKKFVESRPDVRRLAYARIGLDFLAEGPWLGTGLGATKALINPKVARNELDRRTATEFHNEYLQMTLELGVFGLLWLGLLGWWLLSEFREAAPHSFRATMFGAATLALLIAFAWHGLVSFPLRIHAIRVFALVFVAIGLKTVGGQARRPLNRRATWIAMALVVIAVVVILANHYPKARFGSFHEEPKIARAYKYGTYYKIPLFQANRHLARLLGQTGVHPDRQQWLVSARKAYQGHLQRLPTSTRAMNGLFVLEIAEARLNGTEVDQAQFRAWLEKAESIGDLVNPDNYEGRLARLFFYEVFEERLDETDRAEYERLKKVVTLRRQEAINAIRAEQVRGFHRTRPMTQPDP